MKFLRIIKSVTTMDKIRNENLKGKLEVESILKTI